MFPSHDQEEVKAELEAENERLRSADNVRVETVIEERVKVEEVIRYVEREISQVDVSNCRALSVDWVRVYNAAAGANCGAAEVGAHCAVIEATLSPVELDAGGGVRP